MRRNRRRHRARSGRDAAEKARGRCYIRPVKAALCVYSVGTNLSTRARWISHPSVVRALRGRCIWPGKERRFRSVLLFRINPWCCAASSMNLLIGDAVCALLPAETKPE